MKSLRTIYNRFANEIIKLLTYVAPKYVATKEYRRVFGKNIDWKSPKDLIQKIYWLQLNSDTSLWTRCADKFLVREFVKDRGCEDILNDVYASWYRIEEVDFMSLPDSFVLKANNSCGDVVFVKDKNSIDTSAIISIINRWLHSKYGRESLQLHYTRIVPCVIAEKMLGDGGGFLIDYKIWCFNGEPEFVLVVHGRTRENHLLTVYDLNWNNITEIAIRKTSASYSGRDIPKPVSFDGMLTYARKLSQGFPEVRVDFYEINKRPVFGELTFTAGYANYNIEFLEHLGSKLVLPSK